MRALIAGIVFAGGVCTACTHSASSGVARYSGDTAPTPVVVRRDVPVWPTATTPAAPAPGASTSGGVGPVVTYAPAPAPSYAPPRTSAPQPIVLSSRSSPTYAPPSYSPPSYATAPANRASTMLPPPASRARTAAELAAALRPINATCPVMLGSPVDPSVTASYQGRVVAFSDARSRTAWLAEPERYTRNLPGTAGFGSSSDGAVFAAAPAPSARTEAPAYAPLPPTVTSRPMYAEPAPMYAPLPSPSSAPAAVLAPAPRPTPAPAVTRAAAPPPSPAAAPEDEDAGGVCTGGNCGLPPRRK